MKSPNATNCLRAVLFIPMFVMWTASISQDLLIFPKRIVFDGTRRQPEIINLTNTGMDTAAYEISFVQIRMKKDGNFENITVPDEGQRFANEYLRFFPRKVVLGPNESQVVKVQLTRTTGLEPGEYRSHLYFRSVPKTKPLGEEEMNDPENPSSISVRLIPVYGITIPTIIRIGESRTSVSVSNVSLDQDSSAEPFVHVDFNRSGNMSTYGDIEITHTSPDGKTTKVGEVKGFAVYTPGMVRRAKILLKDASGVDLARGKLRVSYTTQEATGRKVQLAGAELTLD